MLDDFDSIIFDLGGVIANLDMEKSLEAFSKIAAISKLEIYQKFFHQKEIFDDYEKGDLSPKEFRDSVRKLMQIDCSDREFDLAVNSMLLDIPQSRINLLQNLKAHKNIYLLSNINEIQHQHIEIIFSQSYGDFFTSLSSVFHQAYFSYLMRDRKPNPSIFQKVIELEKLNPKRTLFIDDFQENIEGAKTTQLQTIHLVKPSTIEDLDLFQQFL